MDISKIIINDDALLMKTPEDYEAIIKKLIWSNYKIRDTNDPTLCYEIVLSFGLFTIIMQATATTTLDTVHNYLFKKVMEYEIPR